MTAESQIPSAALDAAFSAFKPMRSVYYLREELEAALLAAIPHLALESTPAQAVERHITPVGPVDGWCSRCGCGNDSANFAHLAACQASPTADEDCIAVPRKRLERAVAIVEADGDEHGAGAGLRELLSARTAPAEGEPDPALLVSMATCLNHGFGLLETSRQESILHDMRKLWDEVQGRGYYKPERRDYYMGMVDTARTVSRGDA